MTTLRARGAVGALAGTLLAGLSLGCRGTGKELDFPGHPVIMISIDTLRADHLPAYGYRNVETPAIDALAKDGVVFENAYSQYPLTLPSHSTLLTGQLPPRHGVRDNAGYTLDGKVHRTLASRFGAAGYETGGFVSAYVLRGDTGVGSGFATYDCEIEIEPGASLDSGQRSGFETAQLATTWLESRKEKPFLLFLHLYEPHSPYAPPEPFRTRYGTNPYDGEIATADAIVGRFVADLRRLGIYDRAILTLSGDHGEGLGEHGERQHGVFLYRSTTHVPLLVKLPGRASAGERIARAVGLVDLAPTLLSLTGLPLDAELDGQSLFAAPPAGAPERSIYAETYYPRLHFGWSDQQALYESRFAYIDSPEPELHDLSVDPNQLVNVLAENRREYNRLRDLVATIDRPLEDPKAVDRETAEKLAGLGYLSSAPVRSSGALPDPKSQRNLLDKIEGGFEAFGNGDYEKAVEKFRATLVSNDKMVDIWSFLGRSLARLGRHEESLAAWERVLDLSGGSKEVAMMVADIQFRLKRYEKARELAVLARETAPKAADDLLAQIDLIEGHRDAAFARMEAAVQEGHATEGIAYKLAQARLENGRPAEAVKLLEPFVAPDGRAEAATLTLYAKALSDTDRNAEALAVLERALQKDANFAKAHESMGMVLLRLDRAADSKSALERALALDPKLPDAWNTLGVARYQLEGPRPAMEAWKKAIELDGRQFEAMFNLGLVAAQAGDRVEARRVLERFAANAPPDRFAPDIAKARAALAALGGTSANGR